MVRSGSPYKTLGADPPDVDAAFFSISAHCSVSRATSCESSSSLAPSAAVRTMTPALSGTTAFRIRLSRVRSVSGSLRLMPVIELFGT